MTTIRLRIDMFELCVAVRVRRPFGALAHRLQPISGVVLCVNPVGRQEADVGGWLVAALVLVVDRSSGIGIDGGVAAAGPHGEVPPIPHLWLVDQTDRTHEPFELHDGQWLLLASPKDGEPVCIRPFDEIAFSLDNLWP